MHFLELIFNLCRMSYIASDAVLPILERGMYIVSAQKIDTKMQYVGMSCWSVRNNKMAKSILHVLS